ncbi:transcriptional regulator, TetR family [Methylocella silvestris BL2]|uniref:Transcriptional regulator, TetR family n=1 Tax=Methylocella silvestris (strain DSM 15510 / CIP 108128 / LMG 27833 / NCIMB 13906 / BL2) TaxID=395965 RepID=B8EJT1_METSB|nr:TetR family transcriptional regulator [Methylocella silvestris]ACK49485.1 transcriptional regulator, TetR family [Methylocella silvestris BL2]
MNDQPLTPDAILDATEAALRRFGPTKTSVTDVARALKVSHGALYRHFDGKAELIDAVVARWLERLAGPLAVIAAENGPAPERLRRWFDVLIASQSAKAKNDSDLFQAYAGLARANRSIVAAEMERRATHIAKIIDDGAKQGAFAAIDPGGAARAILDATVKFHHPLHADEWSRPEASLNFDAVFRLLLRGLAQ